MKNININQDLTIKEEIVKKIGTLTKTRYARIEMSSRLKKYSEQWKVVMFILNVEAVIFVLLSLGGVQTADYLYNGEFFSLLAGIFSIYVILIQYFVGELNYSERSLKVHYHQLDIEDLNLKLKDLLFKANAKTSPIDDDKLREGFNVVMYEYQTVLKNNENHDPVDYKKIVQRQEQAEGKSRRVSDFTLDNMVLKFNMVLVVLFPLFIFFI